MHMFYKVKTGMFAWIIFRLTGLALAFYLIMHIHVIANLHDPEKFNTIMNFLGSFQFRIIEIGLLTAIIIHSLNGIRILIIDFGNGALYQAKLFWILFATGFILLVVGSYPLISHALYAKKSQQMQCMESIDTQQVDNKLTAGSMEGVECNVRS